MSVNSLNAMLDDLVDVGVVVQAAVQKKIMKALTEGIKRLPDITQQRDWAKLAEEIKSLSDEDKAACLALLKEKLKELQNPLVEQKCLKGVDVALQAFKVIQEAVLVANEAKKLVEEK